MINCNENGCDFCNKKKETDCLCIHAEINALIEAGRSRTIGSDFYTTHFPCVYCARSILQSEVGRVVYSRAETFDEKVFLLFFQAKIQVVFQLPTVGGGFTADNMIENGK